MATISIEEKVVVVEDPHKSAEIQVALNSEEKAFADVKPAVEDTKVKETVREWFCRSRR